MCSMFDSYENIPQNYKPNNIKPNDKLSCAYPTNKIEPYKPILPYEEYNAEGDLIGYYWYYGDELNLEFNLEGEVTLIDSNTYISAEDFVKDKKIIIRLLDFRNNIIAEKVFDASTTIIFPIDKELSKKMVKGVYYCDVTLYNDEFNKTIFSNRDAVFNVK